MSPSAAQSNLAAKNAEYVSSFKDGHLALPPAKQLTVVTCMDARIDPVGAYGINLGDAHIIRNAGGSAKEALRSIVISQQLLGTNEIHVIKHTDCGMLTFDNDTGTGIVEKNLGSDAVEALQTFGGDFLTFPDLEEAVKSDVDLVKSSPLNAKGVSVSGYIYDVKTGKVTQVV